MSDKTFVLDGKTIPYSEGQTIMQAAMAAGVYIPRLCYHPEFKPHGSCKLCTVKANGRQAASCTQLAQSGAVVESVTPSRYQPEPDMVAMPAGSDLKSMAYSGK